MSIPEWGADRPLDEAIVRRAVAEFDPGADLSTLEELGSGWDYDVWALDRRRVARFPRRAEVVDTTRREARFMPRALEALQPAGVRVPEVFAVAEGSETFPHPFLIQRRLWGVPLEALSRSRFSPRLARHLGRTLAAVHGMECEPELLEPPDDYAGDDVAHALEVTSRLDPDLAERIADPLDWLRSDPDPPVPYDGPPVVIHNDLSPEHVRIARNGLTVLGLMDWSDVTLGDPARDFAVLYCWGGAEAVERIVEGYGPVGPEFLDRVRWTARVTALPWLQEVVERGGDTEKHVRWIHAAFDRAGD